MAWKDQPTTPAEFRDIALDVQDDLHLDKKDEAVKKADDGGQRIRSTVKTKGRKATEQIVVDSGASATVAKAIVDEAAKERKIFPSALISVMLSRSQSERHMLTAEAMTSNETSRWIDDVNVSDKQSLAGSNELLAQAKVSGDAYTCFLLALKVSQRVVRSEQALAVAFYALSNDFERDRKTYLAGKATGQVKAVFDLLEKVLDGTASSEEQNIFRKSLIARVEEANSMDPGDLTKPNRPGPDAQVSSKTKSGQSLLVAGYMTTRDDAGKPIDTARSLEKHWRGLFSGLAENAQVLIVLAGASPVAEVARMRGENAERIASWADDVAVLRTASTVFETMDATVMPAILSGKAKFAGWFSSAEPVVLDAGIAETVQQSLDHLMAQGYPASTGRGIEIMTQTLNVLNHWAVKHPESFPYFQDQKVIDWVEKCPVMKGGLASALSNTSLAIDQSQERAILRAEMKRAAREEEIARDLESRPQAAPKDVAKLKKKVMDKLIGEGKRFKDLETSSVAYLLACVNEGDAHSVQRIIDGENPRTVRIEVLEARAAIAFDDEGPQVKNGRAHR
ncbi:hypothetical protein [Paraburkholderia sp. BL21I4N1]|uniref:hypothetical protein n=1 Tax=Paraburkholderia sp. BL21I4N1 TaxID=1938801 RepID=UPI000CFD06D3|nr:hypothetical protein [Paraburkholderia sp. BL21I4N1]PQV53362.1 hypothetical protein B0G83_102448 [Paraburkholderia sp. BL21I4N1]